MDVQVPMKMVNGDLFPLEGKELEAHLAKQELPFQQGAFLFGLREERNVLLAASDIPALKLTDLKLLGQVDLASTKTMARYRQDLRDMPMVVETSEAWADLVTTADLATFVIPWPVAP